MKQILLTLGLVLITTEAFAASVALPIRATIINLTALPLAEAIAFCDERNMECPALRMKHERQATDQNPQGNGNDPDIYYSTPGDTLISDEAGPYHE